MALLLVGLVLLSCASGPETGVRTEYRYSEIDSVAIAPFYASGSFGLDTEQTDEMLRAYEEAAADALEARGFNVVRSRAFEQLLTEHGLRQDFDDGVPLRRGLLHYFEPAPSGEQQPLEIRTLRQIADDDLVAADTILFGEIVYHSSGTCRTRAEDFNPYAVSVIAPTAPSDPPRPCVGSHFQAKLVDARTGRAMWFNRMFLEQHVARVDADIVSKTLVETVERTLTADGGITPLAPRRSDDETRADVD